MKHLVGINHVDVVIADGSPHGPKKFVLWNPPLNCSKPLGKTSSENLSKRGKQERDRHYRREANQVNLICWLFFICYLLYFHVGVNYKFVLPHTMYKYLSFPSVMGDKVKKYLVLERSEAEDHNCRILGV